MSKGDDTMGPMSEAWDATRVEAIYKAINSLLPTLPEFGERVVPAAEFQRHLFTIQDRRQKADRAFNQVSQKLGEANRDVELLKQNLRVQEIHAFEEPDVIQARTSAAKRKLVEQFIHPDRTALAVAQGNLRRIEAVLDAVKSVVASLENARITVNSAINAHASETKFTRSIR